MNISGLYTTKDLSDKIQEITEGEQVSNSTGTNNVNGPVDNDISDFNKGVDIMTNIGNYHVLNEGIFSKKPKSGVYRPDLDPKSPEYNKDVEDTIAEHPMMDIAKGTAEMKNIFPEEKIKSASDEKFDKETERRKHSNDRRSGNEDRRD